MVKAHVDILEDFTQDFVRELLALSEEHEFLIFEDRKFADIGNTVTHQYANGLYRIAEWAHIINAHPIPGPSIVQGLMQVAMGQKVTRHTNRYLQNGARGCLLISDMSTAKNLYTPEYRQESQQMAKDNKSFITGFITQYPYTEDDVDMLTMMPGVQLEAGGDSMGQVYRTPEIVVGQHGADVVIVGRGIYAKPIEEQSLLARTYQQRCWQAYLDRVKP
jgi:orotidine-5'-phosphate decarboxylase